MQAAGERVDLLDDYDFPARTITSETLVMFVVHTGVVWIGERLSSALTKIASFKIRFKRAQKL